MHKQIFIGGTGRSGTSICYNFLRTHPEIHAFGLELRFLIDYNGLLNVVDALSDNFSTVQAREALWHFEKMMKHDLTNSKKPPYLGLDFLKIFGEQHYNKTVDGFLESLTDSKWLGSDYQVEPDFFNQYFYSPYRMLEKILSRFNQGYKKIFKVNKPAFRLWPKRVFRDAKYFSKRSEIVETAADFVDTLFHGVASTQGKTHWCEKTPHNFLHIDFLFELFPNSYFIHMVRDPRGVAQSYANQFWAPQDIETISHMLKKMYDRWFFLKEKNNSFSNLNYFELKLEDCALNNEIFKVKICDFLGLANSFINPPRLTMEKVDYWEMKLSKTDRKIIEKILGSEIEKLGYPL